MLPLLTCASALFALCNAALGHPFSTNSSPSSPPSSVSTLTSGLLHCPPTRPHRNSISTSYLCRGPPFSIIEWLLAYSTNSPRILELRDLNSEELVAFFEHLSPRIQSLRIFHYSRGTPRGCTNLKELVISSVHPLLQMTNIAFPWTHQPCELGEHLSVDLYRYRTLAFAVRSLPNLKTIQCDIKTLELPNSHILVDACRTECIALNTESPKW